MSRNKKDRNYGFSLVELIVVIVILAILIGVTIGGIYQYVNKARINTDINTAKQLDSTLSAALAETDEFGGVFHAAKKHTWLWYWTDEVPLKFTEKQNYGIHVYYDFEKKICDTLDKLPKSKTGKGFCFYIYWDGNGMPSSKVFALADEDVPYDLSYFKDKKGLTDIKWYPKTGFYWIQSNSDSDSGTLPLKK